MSLSENVKSVISTRYLLPASLALNLVFVGAAGAVALRHSSPAPLQPVVGIKHSVSQRLDLVITSLPADDARIMRAVLRADAVKLAQAEAELRLSQEAVRNTLRAEPYDPAAVRQALSETSTARDHFFQVLHEALASATAKMSIAGRQTLADWPIKRGNVVLTQ